MKNKLKMAILLLVSAPAALLAAPMGISAFTISPSLSNTTVSSEGETSVYYTVTNNASSTLSNVVVTPGYNSIPIQPEGAGFRI